jgi:hypothetical protein
MIGAPLVHGGVYGAIAESLVAISVIGVFAAIWLRERSARKHGADDEVTGSRD